MTRHNAALTLPPGDRDDVESRSVVDQSAAQPSILPDDEPAQVAGRKPCAPGLDAEIAILARAHEAAATALAELSAANARGDWPAFESVAWAYAEGHLVNWRSRAFRLRKLITDGRRQAALARQQEEHAA